MVIHILLVMIISGLGLVIYHGGKLVNVRRNKLFVWLSLFGVFLIQSLRGPSVGWDTYRYEIAFQGIRQGYYSNMTQTWEPLFLLLNKIIGKFTDNPQWMLAACSLIIVTGYGYFVLKNTDSNECAFWPIFFFITIYNYFNSSNLLREYLALAFVINAYTVLGKGQTRRHWIIAVLLMIIGFLFHRTAIIGILLLVPFVIDFKNSKQLVLVALGAVVVFVAYDRVMNIFLSLFPYFSKYENGSRISGASGIGASYLAITLIKIIMILMVLFSRSDKYKSEMYSLTYVMIIAAMFTILRTRVSLALRAGYYYEVFFPLCIMKFVNRMKRVRQIVFFLAYLFGWAFFIYTMMNKSGGSRGNVPYYFFWQT